MNINRTFLTAAGFVLIAVLCWSGNFVLGRFVRGDIVPTSLSFWRWAVATIVLLPVAFSVGRQQWRIAFAHWPVLAGLGLLGAALFQTMSYIGLQGTLATNAVLLTAANPISVMLLAWLVLGEKANLRQMIGMVISFAGMIILASHGDLDGLRTFSFNTGDLWIVGAVLVWGGYSVLLQFTPAGVSPMFVVFLTAFTGTLFIAPFYIRDILVGDIFALNITTLSAIAYTGLFASVLAFFSFNAAVARIGPSRASFFLHLMPVLGALMAFFFLGEDLQGYHFVGFAVTLGGVLFATSG